MSTAVRLTRIARGLYRTPRSEVVVADRAWEKRSDGRWQVRWKSQTFPGVWESHERYVPTLRDALALTARLMGAL